MRWWHSETGNGVFSSRVAPCRRSGADWIIRAQGDCSLPIRPSDTVQAIC